MRLIGIAGKAGSGKDYLAQQLRRFGWFKWAYAWPLKQLAVGRGFSWEDVHLHKPPRVREFLQQFGTEQGRDVYGEDYWVRTTAGFLTSLESENDVHKVVITDVRFPNEAAWIKAQGGVVVRMEHGDRPYPLAGTPAAAHASETAMDYYPDYDAIIINRTTSTAEDLLWALSNAGIEVR